MSADTKKWSPALRRKIIDVLASEITSAGDIKVIVKLALSEQPKKAQVMQQMTWSAEPKTLARQLVAKTKNIKARHGQPYLALIIEEILLDVLDEKHEQYLRMGLEALCGTSSGTNELTPFSNGMTYNLQPPDQEEIEKLGTEPQINPRGFKPMSVRRLLLLLFFLGLHDTAVPSPRTPPASTASLEIKKASLPISIDADPIAKHQVGTIAKSDRSKRVRKQRQTPPSKKPPARHSNSRDIEEQKPTLIPPPGNNNPAARSEDKNSYSTNNRPKVIDKWSPDEW